MFRTIRRESGERSGGCSSPRVLKGSSLRVQVWWMLMITSHSIEISIAGGVGEMVRELTTLHFCFFFLYHAFIVSRYKKLRAALAMERTKPISQKH